MTIWTILNSPAVIAVVASLAAWALSKLYLANPAWAVWEGVIISAIKYAEKAIPDTASNKGVRRLDAAMRQFLTEYKEIKGKSPSRRLATAVRAAIPMIHARIESRGKA